MAQSSMTKYEMFANMASVVLRNWNCATVGNG